MKLKTNEYYFLKGLIKLISLYIDLTKRKIQIINMRIEREANHIGPMVFKKIIREEYWKNFIPINLLTRTNILKDIH